MRWILHSPPKRQIRVGIFPHPPALPPPTPPPLVSYSTFFFCTFYKSQLVARKNGYGNSKCCVIMSWNFWFSFKSAFFFYSSLFLYDFIRGIVSKIWRSQFVKTRNPLIFTMRGKGGGTLHFFFCTLNCKRPKSFTFLAVLQKIKKSVVIKTCSLIYV